MLICLTSKALGEESTLNVNSRAFVGHFDVDVSATHIALQPVFIARVFQLTLAGGHVRWRN
jgi:hypothetical protein